MLLFYLEYCQQLVYLQTRGCNFKKEPHICAVFSSKTTSTTHILELLEYLNLGAKKQLCAKVCIKMELFSIVVFDFLYVTGKSINKQLRKIIIHN